MGTNAAIVISDRHEDAAPVVLAGLYAQFNGGVTGIGGALVRALDRVVLVPGEIWREVREAIREATPAQHDAVLAWRAASGAGIPVLLIARLFGELDDITPGATMHFGGKPWTGFSWRYSHNALRLQAPDAIDLDGCVYRYFVEPRPYDRPWSLGGLALSLPRPWLKVMCGRDEVIFEGWPEDAMQVFGGWRAAHGDA